MKFGSHVHLGMNIVEFIAFYFNSRYLNIVNFSFIIHNSVLEWFFCIRLGDGLDGLNSKIRPADGCNGYLDLNEVFIVRSRIRFVYILFILIYTLKIKQEFGEEYHAGLLVGKKSVGLPSPTSFEGNLDSKIFIPTRVSGSLISIYES